VILMWTFHCDGQPLYAWIYDHLFLPIGFYWGSLAFALWWMLTCWVLGWWMDKKKIYVRL
ncbi:MAG: DUF5009 domain-containing protein, partial [Chitinophagaceae bacterium]